MKPYLTRKSKNFIMPRVNVCLLTEGGVINENYLLESNFLISIEK